MPTDTPRAGETWERVRDGERVEVWEVSAPHFALEVQVRYPSGEIRRYWASTFLREFRRVEAPSDGRET